MLPSYKSFQVSVTSLTAHVSYLSLPAGRVNLDFLGNRFFLWGPALRGVPACLGIREAPEGRGYCCGTCRWGSGSVTCWRESFVLQQQRRREGNFNGQWQSYCIMKDKSLESGVLQCQKHFQCSSREICSTYRLLAARKPVWRWFASCSEEQSRPGYKEERF